MDTLKRPSSLSPGFLPAAFLAVIFALSLFAGPTAASTPHLQLIGGAQGGKPDARFGPRSPAGAPQTGGAMLGQPDGWERNSKRDRGRQGTRIALYDGAPDFWESPQSEGKSVGRVKSTSGTGMHGLLLLRLLLIQLRYGGEGLLP